MYIPHPCYSVVALSDLAVSGGFAFQRQICPAQIFPKPLQRDHLSLPPGDSALNRTPVPRVKRFCILDCDQAHEPGVFGSVELFGVVPQGDDVACGSSGRAHSLLNASQS